MEIQSFFYDLLLFVMFVAFCITSYKHKGLPSVLKPITWYLLVEFIGQAIIITMLWWFPKQNKSLPLHIAFPLEAIALFLMYREIFKKYVEVGGKGKYIYRKIFTVLIVLFVVFAVVNALCWQPINIYPSNTRTVLSVMIIILNILYIYKYTSHEPVPRTGLELVNYQMSRLSLFWITTGLLTFHSFAVLRYMFINILRKELSEEAYRYMLNVYMIFAVILFVFIIIGILKAKRIIVVDDESKVDNKQ